MRSPIAGDTAMAETTFPPLKRELLLEQELPPETPPFA